MQRKGGLAGRNPSGAWNRLRPVTEDPLEEYGLPSKGDRRLLIPSNQERFYGKIAERYMSFCTEAGDSTSLLKSFASLHLTDAAPTPASSTPAPSPAPSSTDLSHILAALRKLREGIVASKRADAFATQVYLFAIRLGILCAHPETYHPALLHLLRVIHPRHALTAVELHEAASYLVLDAACRRGDLAEAYRLRNSYRLRDGKIDAVLAALVRDDWVAFFRVKKGVDGHRARLLEFAEDAVRRHLLKAFGRAYLSAPVKFLEASSGLEWEELRTRYKVGWELDDGRVVIRKIQGRS
ncbi:hypothetical protein CONLIGDRAFT_383587 [Coniochaeta ligniaria NRRL 30616]|uniref:CSN8/PSMD8/EIF3K domain-containing protein n=1 Tax=Coniochaeta ligniaria NRRL 30616 TaxID=1408157 RepID=A0A1J7IM71_9PEZI|nr:hypothetical protein CONLIGDRAFT_383587 [Coniochaeta ligniaria NRRL 30616]